MARVRHKRKPVAEMNVVPYIDVMLVLLVIFMVTAPMLNQGSRSTCRRCPARRCLRTTTSRS